MYTPITTAIDEHGKTFSVGETWIVNHGPRHKKSTIAAIMRSRASTSGFLVSVVEPESCEYLGIYFSDNLVEKVTPYSDFKIDDPVWVRNRVNDEWIPRHFAGIKNDLPSTFDRGTTSHTAPQENVAASTWNFCVKVKPE